AEDGIRDFHVTRVQTCALPICGDAGDDEAGRFHEVPRLLLSGDRWCQATVAHGESPPTAVRPRNALPPHPFHGRFAVTIGRTARSEERRVGKWGMRRWVTGGKM